MIKKTETKENDLFDSPSNLRGKRTSAHYRIKGDQKIKGYSVNITETNDKDGKP